MPTSLEVYNQIVSGYKSINTETSKLEPSVPVVFYEIDLTQIYPQIRNTTTLTNQPLQNGILRIYNDYNLYNLSSQPYGTITWKNNQYFPMPVHADGFEMNSAGTLPTPRIFIANSSPDTSTNSFYKYIRLQIQSLGDIVGAKFTRIKTFLKYLNGVNFSGGFNPYTDDPSISEIELPKDIYYIDRKSQEDNLILEYSLGSILDVEGVFLPSRTIFSNKCPFEYRGEGCLYEYDSRRSIVHSGVYGGVVNSNGVDIRLLQTAPPVATENDQLFLGSSGSVFVTGVNTYAVNRITGGAGNLGAWNTGQSYTSGDFIYLQNTSKLNYYFVCINNHTSSLENSPPNTTFWLADSCSKSISSCRLRWLKNPAFRPVIWPTNRGGWDLNYYKLADRALRTAIEATSQLSPPAFVNTGINSPFPRRPACWNPNSDISHGIPKDYLGNYLNGFLPFGGFPGTDQPNNQ
jgi:lambda family phage minor tail protein L